MKSAADTPGPVPGRQPDYPAGCRIIVLVDQIEEALRQNEKRKRE
jgi:hypothetical protein